MTCIFLLFFLEWLATAKACLFGYVQSFVSTIMEV